jgi:hypothetical protein
MTLEVSALPDANRSTPAKKPGAVLILLPMLIALIGLGAIVLGQIPATGHGPDSGYGIDDIRTGAVPALARTPLITPSR